MIERSTSHLRVLIEVATATGDHRAVNEDGVVIDPATGACAVIDGGGANGALATALIQVELGEVLDSLLQQPEATPEAALAGSLEQLSARLQQANRSDPRMGGSGAAVTAVLVHEDHAHLAHCGDARAYLLRDAALEQLTTDDTMVAELVASGELEPDQAISHPYSNIVTQVLGFSDTIEVRSYERVLQAGDVLLLCTDGLWRAVPPTELADLCLGPVEELHRVLVDRAVALGTDNVAVVVIRLEGLSDDA